MKKTYLYLAIIILSITVVGGLFYSNKVKTQINIEQKPNMDIVNNDKSLEKKEYVISLFFGKVDSLSIEDRNVTAGSQNDLPRIAMEELIKGPKNAGLSSTIPVGTRINSVSLNDALATVDLSQEFVENHTGGSEAENLTIYSIVNTLCEIPSINRVQFLVDGQKRSIFKHFTLDDIFVKNQSIIEKQ